MIATVEEFKQKLSKCEKTGSLRSIYPSKMSYWDKIAMLDCWGIKHFFFDVNKKYLKEIKDRIKSSIEFDKIMKKFMENLR